MDIGKPVRKHINVPAPAGPDHVPDDWPEVEPEPVTEPATVPAEPEKVPV